jgi:DNA polymerase III subunit epsilon
MISRALIIDTETNGLEDTAEVIEVGAILYSVENQCVLQEMSTLLPAATNAAEPINRIKVQALDEIMSTRSVSFALELLFVMSKAADVYVAHNAEFDSKKMFGDTRFLPLASLPWLCTMSDFKWPLATREQGSLINIALDHGIGVASAHRALTDCRLIASLFDRMADLQGMFEVAMRPKGLFQAIVPFERKDEAKAAGFKWNGADKTWTRQMAIEDAAALGFPVRQLQVK